MLALTIPCDLSKLRGVTTAKRLARIQFLRTRLVGETLHNFKVLTIQCKTLDDNRTSEYVLITFSHPDVIAYDQLKLFKAHLKTISDSIITNFKNY